MLKNYLIVAWRNMSRHKLYTTIHVIGLAVGICACLAIWTITHYELSFDKFHPDKERIYRVVLEIGQTSGEHSHYGDVPEPTVGLFRKELSGLEVIAQFHNYNATVSIPGEHGQVKKFPKAVTDQIDDQVFAEPQYFDLFKYKWLAGNPAALSEPFRVVLSSTEAQKYFGSDRWSDILGRTVVYDDSIRVTVAGIVKDWDQVTDFKFRDFISYATVRATGLKNDLGLDEWGNTNSSSELFLKLAKGVSQARVDAELKAFMVKHHDLMANKDQYYQMLLQPLSDLHYSTLYDKDFGTQANLKTLYQLMGVAIFILILASINFINLSTAQSLKRAREIGIRKVLGSRRVALVVQFMSETLLLVLFSLLLSMAALRPLLAAFPAFVPEGLTVNLLDPAMLGFALLVLLVAAGLSGLYPALVLSSFQPARTLKGQGSTPGGLKNWLGKGLVVFQFTISAVFIISAIVIGHQMRFMLHKDMGFSQDAIIHFNTEGKDGNDKRKLLAERLRLLSGVDMVSMDWAMPAIHGAWSSGFEYKPAGYKADIYVRTADANYVPLYGLKLLAGRNYFPSDTLREMLINATFARQLGFLRPEDAVGKPLTFWGKPCVVTGVLADFNMRSLQHAIEPAAVFPSVGNETGFSVKLHARGKEAADFQGTIAKIEKNWKDIFGDEPFSYKWVDEYIGKLYQSEQKTATLINLTMIITVLISCMGLFGLAALSAEKRTREIGIRKVLGAGVVNIAAMVSKDFVILVGIALLIASPVAWYFLHGWLADYSYRVGIGWWVFVLSGLGAVGVALVTVGFHAVRAGMANPIKSLRSE